MYGWGVSWGEEASREEKYDEAMINVPVQDLNEVVEKFTIQFEYNVNMSLMWDKTKVMVPISF